MKNKIYLLLILLAVSTYSCKKQDDPIKDEIKKDVFLDGDHLAFKDYETFLNYFKSVGGMSKNQRKQWEESLAFTSMQTLYETFNLELDELEKGSRENYFKGFSMLKEKYKGTLLFTENSYRLNNSGLREAILTNRNGVVKVGQEYLYFNEKGVVTKKGASLDKVIFNNGANGKISSAPNSQMDILEVAPPANNSATSSIGPWNFIYKGDGRVYLRTKAYNFHTSALDYQSFASLEGWSEHKNIFGTYRSVGMGPSFTSSTIPGYVIPKLYITRNNLANNYAGSRAEGYNPNANGAITLNPNLFEGLNDVENFDRVMCISKGIESNPSGLSTVGYSGEFSNYAVDTFPGEAGVFWSGVDLSTTWFIILIQPGGVLGNPSVLFNPFRIDSGAQTTQYQ